ncbi:DUF3558 domain-containing protein [Amycolatopsis sp. PS_44_ISF1]|uniref:DUF3558 domain-containing protein n=1 Tax=Amycolatopsis sp. PS_44_ISF1 TaxID=2974917 RepID=UPI0028E00C8D|nr:DUF3558 domain-containing protein [Amycolatopsis sp. PS_44_ISF1]MDT8911443.1 DUF3558 domain-containing protein [Amycolatopsis sp. PS_44_ISF1]
MKRSLMAGTAAVTALVLAACSPQSHDETPMASAGPSISTGNKLVAPRVPNALNVSKFEQDPCTVLSPAQAGEIANWTTSSKADGNAAPICTWADKDHNTVTIGFVPGNGGLTTSYKNQDSKYGYFAVAPDVEGYPAVYSAAHDDRGEGGCLVAVGVSDDEVFTTSVSFRKNLSPHYSDPCPVASRTAEAAMVTIKGGA